MKRWQTKLLGDLCEVRIGRTPRRDQSRFWGGENIWITVGELAGGVVASSKEHITDEAVRECMPEPIPEGTLLFSFKLSIGKMAVSGCPLYTNEAIAALVIKDTSEISRDFLRYALMSESRESSANTAVLGKLLNKEKVRQLIIPVPPMVEQERIVRILDEADELRKLRAKADRRTADLIPALFHEMFGDPASNPRRLPTQTLGSLTTVIGGGTPSTKNSSYWDGIIPWVSSKDMSVEEVYDTQDHISENALADSATQLIPLESVLVVTRSGILKHTLPVALNMVDVAINQDIKAFIPNASCRSLFLAAQLRVLAPTILSIVRTGATVHNIETDALKKLHLLVPPVHEQDEFALKIKEVRTLRGDQAASRQRLEALFQSLLHHAFNGAL